MTRKINIAWLLVVLGMSLTACGQQKQREQTKQKTMNTTSQSGLEVATFGAGCFWCVEAIFQRVKGVTKVESGYSGGSVEDPTYKAVCAGTTGHAEVCQLTFDPKVVSYETLLEIFWKTHDPTTLNRQGADVGTQYRSAVFYHSDQQRELAEYWKKKLNDAKVFPNPIVTEIAAFDKFYGAEDYHQNYFNENGYQPYCQIVIKPKVEKFTQVFKDKLNQ
jgi:peptide-methionine (S)-S-oxide reductase